MRIDQVLHWLCLTKSRSLAARGCREGRILLNDGPVRPSKGVCIGDRVSLLSPTGSMQRVIRLQEIPRGQQSRQQASEHYETLFVQRVDPVFDSPQGGEKSV